MRIAIKMGGDLIKGESINTPLIEDIRALTQAHSVVVVHGGGDIVTDMAKRLGKE